VIKKNSPQAVPDIMFCDLFHINKQLHKSQLQVKLTFSYGPNKINHIDYEYVIIETPKTDPAMTKKNLTCVNCTFTFIM